MVAVRPVDESFKAKLKDEDESAELEKKARAAEEVERIKQMARSNTGANPTSQSLAKYASKSRPQKEAIAASAAASANAPGGGGLGLPRVGAQEFPQEFAFPQEFLRI